MVVNNVVRMFEGEAHRILWLPPISLGYLFTVTGVPLDFWLAVFSIPGARLLHKVVRAIRHTVVEKDTTDPTTGMSNVLRGFDSVALVTFAVLLLIYGSTFIRSILQLRAYFSQNDVIIVGISILYWGVFLVVAMDSMTGTVSWENNSSK